jgi:hypothetical protein
MWLCIASLMVGGLLGFFIAGILAASKRLSELDHGFEEAAVDELYNHVRG